MDSNNDPWISYMGRGFDLRVATLVAVPEPGTGTLGIVLFGVAAMRRRPVRAQTER